MANDKTYAITAFVEEGFTFVRAADTLGWKIDIVTNGQSQRYGDYVQLDREKMMELDAEDQEEYILEMFDVLKQQAHKTVAELRK